MNATTLLETSTYNVDPSHSSVRFWVRHLMISKVHGEFSKISGLVRGSLRDPEKAEVEVTIDVASISTGNEQRDGHLKNSDFLDIETFPTMTYRSTSVRRIEGNEFEVLGDLTLHGVTRQVPLRAEITDEVPSPFGGFKVGVTATGVVLREDFGVTYNQVLETGGVALGKEIHLQIDLELDRQP